MIKAGLVTVNGTAVRASCTVRPGDRIEIASLTPAKLFSQVNPTGQPPASLEVLFADEELLAVNKPAGMPVHPSPGHPDSTLADLLNATFPDLAKMAEPDGVMRAGIVHRLDKETSGVMVVARTSFARMVLSQQFKERTVKKAYLAIVRGVVQRDRFTVDRPLGRHPTERKRMSIRSRKPRSARTDFLVLHRFLASADPATLLKAQPQTGRTHQIRVHLAAAGHPCLGDTLYGGRSSSGWTRRGQALHALALTIAHPRSNEQLELIAPLPDDMKQFILTRGLAIESLNLRRWIDAA